jgi:hypothetical protein
VIVGSPIVAGGAADIVTALPSFVVGAVVVSAIAGPFAAVDSVDLHSFQHCASYQPKVCFLTRASAKFVEELVAGLVLDQQ